MNTYSQRTINGLPIIDATGSLALVVTDKDIHGASVKDPNQCVLARACRRTLHVKEVRVHLGRVYVLSQDGGHWTRYLTPASLRSELIAFDRGGRFSRGEYNLVRPIGNKKLGGHSPKRSPHTSIGYKRRKPHIVSDVRAAPLLQK